MTKLKREKRNAEINELCLRFLHLEDQITNPYWVTEFGNVIHSNHFHESPWFLEMVFAKIRTYNVEIEEKYGVIMEGYSYWSFIHDKEFEITFMGYGNSKFEANLKCALEFIKSII